MFRSPDDVRERLAGVGYLADTATATTVFLAASLERGGQERAALD